MGTAAGGIDVDVENHVATLTIDNPAKRNALRPDMYERLISVLGALGEDARVRVVVLTGAGPHFSAGSDIAHLAQLHRSELPVAAEEALAGFAKPVVAAIRGFCLGGGVQLATACDIRVAADTALFATPPAKLGIVYPLSATRRLISLIGPSAAKYLVFSGDQVNATRALHMGLVEELVTPDLLDARARHIAATISRRSQLTLQATKQIVDDIVAERLHPDLVDWWVGQAERGPDLPEGMSAFAARRQPSFSWTGPEPDDPAPPSLHNARHAEEDAGANGSDEECPR